ncbi:MAG: helix-turn-helix domain-containing protein [Gammaproteobacteria bacterium]|nr:helix-turn-helix domain-containing protein [Gammaproteobacteria bacterium]MCW5584399.1 helix-turn-helix domain-containing protein [Gammaproteobacteria bacterium]
MQITRNDKGINIPTDKEISLARESSRKLAAYIKSTNHPSFQLMKRGKGDEIISIPADALRLLVMILSQMAKGNAITLIPVHAELTTQEAADLLNVSRPFLVNLLEEKKIPFHKVGSRRRVFAKDILRYKEEIDKKRLEILEELANEAQKHNMGY